MLRGSLISVGASLAIQGLNMISGVLIARLLGPGGKGELTAVLLWPGLLAAVGSFGLGSAVVYFAAASVGREREISATAFAIALVESAVLVVLGSLLMSSFLGHYGPHIVAVGLLYLTWIPPYLLAMAALSVLQGKFELRAFNVLRLSVTGAAVLGVIGLAYLHQLSVLNVVLVTLAANLLNLALSLSLLAWRGWIGFRPRADLIRPLMTYGLKSHSGNIAGLVNASADQAIIALFLAPAALGLYSIAVTWSALIVLLSTSLGLVAFPAVARARTPPEKRHHLSEFVRATFLISALLAAGLALAAPFLIKLLFGPAFAPATQVAQLLLLAAVILAMNRVLSEALRGFNQPLVPGLAEGIAALVTLASLAALLPILGIMGAAVASLLAYSTSLGYMVWFCATRLGISPATLVVPRPSDWELIRSQFAAGWRLLRRGAG